MDNPASALDEWLRVLRPAGRLVLIEGHWSTGAGVPAAAIVDLLEEAGRPASVMPLLDASLWGQEITDERYAIVSPAPADTGDGAS
jgi:SAM-dependent methyltransferase